MIRRGWLLFAALLLACPLAATELPLGELRTSGEVFTYNYSPVIAANGSEWLAAWNQEAARVDANGNVIDRPVLRIARRPMRVLLLGSSYLLAGEGDSHEVVLTRYEPADRRETVIATIPTAADRILAIDLDTDGSSVLVTWIESFGSGTLGVALFDSHWNLVKRTAVAGPQYVAACASRSGGYLVVSAGSDGLWSRILTASGTFEDPVLISTGQRGADVTPIGAGYLVAAPGEACVLDASGNVKARESVAALASGVRVDCGDTECLAISNRSLRDGYSDVTAARFAVSDGQLLDSGTLIHTTKTNSRWTSGGDGVDVAWNGQRFLVVTSNGYLSFTINVTNVFGRLFSPGERISPNEPTFLISYDTVPQTALAAAVNGTIERLVWSEPTRCPSPDNPIYCSGWALHTQGFDDSEGHDADTTISTNTSLDTTSTKSAIAADSDGFVVAFIESGILRSAHIGRDGTVSDRREIATAATSLDATNSFVGPAIAWISSDGVVHLLVNSKELTLGNAGPRSNVSIASDGVGALVAWTTGNAIVTVRVELTSLTTSSPEFIQTVVSAGPFVAFNGISYAVGFDSDGPNHDTRTVRAFRFTIAGRPIDREPIVIARGNVWLTAVGAKQDHVLLVLIDGDTLSLVIERLLPSGQLMANSDGSVGSVGAMNARDGVIAKSSARRIAYVRRDYRAYVKELDAARRHGVRTGERRHPIRLTSP